MLHAPAAGGRVLGLPAGVVFDNDGLLLDTEEAWTRAEVTLFRRYGREFTIEHKRDIIGSARDVAAGKLELMLERPGEGFALMDELHELVMDEALAEPVAVRPGALDLIRALSSAGVGMAVASNSPRAFLDRVLGGSGLAEQGVSWVATIAGDEVEHPKPAPDIYLEACASLGAAPQDCVALEDSPTGVAAAVAAEMRVIGVPYFPDQELPGAHVVASSLADPSVYAAVGLQIGDVRAPIA